MREILFRGKCIDETCLKGKWIDGQILHDGVSGKHYIHRDNCLNESDNVGEEGLLRFVAYEVDPKTICQYTGLSDKNCRKIFEGDIVKLPKCENDIAVFVLEGCNYFLKGKRSNYVLESYQSECYEVIGNIFDNPELIGDQP